MKTGSGMVEWVETVPLHPSCRDVNGTLLSEDTEHQLLGVMDAIAQQMVEGGFATKAERRLASRLHALLEKSVAPEPAAAEEATADKGELLLA